MPYSWEQIQQILAAEISGEEPKPMMSKRTLFGIPSSIEVMMEEAAKEATRKRAAELAREKAEGAQDPQPQDRQEGPADAADAEGAQEAEPGNAGATGSANAD